MEYIQDSFLGGINQQVDPTRIGKNQYFLGINVRNRKDVAEPIKLPLDITNKKPEGKIQGIYAASNLLILFVNGRAYYQDFRINTDVNLIQIPGFQMSQTVDMMYAEFIPASRFNIFRTKNNGDTNMNGPVNMKTSLNANGSPAALVVQDGFNQPFLITADQGARKLQTYSEWQTGVDGVTEDKREYVPIGKQMLHTNGVLWIAAPDGRELFRSVIGRPLDFVIAITGVTGDKAGGAETTSIKPDYNPVTCLKEVPTGQTVGFFCGTAPVSRVVIPGVDALCFGEPLNFRFQFLFPAGPVNQNCIGDIGGDTSFITDSGIRSFNGTSQLMYESTNDPLSASVYQLFLSGVQQTTPCCKEFDNFTLYAVQTIYGAGILVYDTMSKSFCSLDLYPNVSQIVQFAVVQYGSTKRLFFYTDENKLYEGFASNVTATAQLYIGEWTSGDPKVEQKGNMLRLVVVDAKEAGTISASIFVDRKRGASGSRVIEKRIDDLTVPQTIPFGTNETKDTVQNITFSDFEAAAGWKIGYLIIWNCQANISHIGVGTVEQTASATGQEQASDLYKGQI